MSFLESVRERRQNLADVLADPEYSGIRSTVEELYPDTAHFIYELLQNAHDREAKHVVFHLSCDSLCFEHDGGSFTEDNVWAITNIGKPSKANSPDQIGKFGIGFKAVFGYTETPQVWSPTFSFELRKLVLPYELPADVQLGTRTRFRFPFNNAKKLPEVAWREIAAGLEGMSEMALLFLTHIKSISWEIDNKGTGTLLRTSGQGNHHVVIERNCKNKTTSRKHFLRVTNPVQGLEEQCVGVAFELEHKGDCGKGNFKGLGEDYFIVESSPGLVFVYFPAEKETSGLRFHVHAPFVPELSRASVKDSPANDPLYEQLATLIVAALAIIRDEGLLSVDFLSVLPNDKDELPQHYQLIRQAILAAMTNQKLTPTYKKSHAPAKTLLQARATMKELLAESDLKALLTWDSGPPKWAVAAAQKSSNADRFISSLAIREWDVDELLRVFEKGFAARDRRFLSWIKGKSDEWIQRFYAHLTLRENDIHIPFKEIPMIRLDSGKYAKGRDCFFPGVGKERSKSLPRVSMGVFSSGTNKAEHARAKTLLEKCGVREVTEKDEVMQILRVRYGSENVSFRPNLRDTDRFIKLIKSLPTESHQFRNHRIFKCVEGTWVRPSRVYLDAPFLDTGLNAYFGDGAYSRDLRALSRDYLDIGVDAIQVGEFAMAVGAVTALKAGWHKCSGHPRWDELKTGYSRKSNHDGYGAVDCDSDIPEFETLLQLKSIEASLLIWRTMIDLDSMYFKAKFKWNNKSTLNELPSRLIEHLKTTPWVPQRNGTFVDPAMASADLLPDGFTFEGGWAWLAEIGFGDALRLPAAETANSPERNDARFRGPDWFTERGMSADEASQYAEFGSMNAEQRATAIAAGRMPGAPAFPVKEAPDPIRRAQRLGEGFGETPAKTYEKRERSVRTSKSEFNARTNLSSLYENEDQQLICQCCAKEMPFKKEDGQYHFESVELLKDVPTEQADIKVALCPICSAMYKFYIKEVPERLSCVRTDILAWRDSPPQHGVWEILIALRPDSPIGPTLKLRFVETHALDLLEILEHYQS